MFRGGFISQRKVIDIMSVYKNNMIHFPNKLGEYLDVTPPCELLLEVNEDDEVVIRKNEAK